MHQIQLWLGLCPNPAGGAHSALPGLELDLKGLLLREGEGDKGGDAKRERRGRRKGTGEWRDGERNGKGKGREEEGSGEKGKKGWKERGGKWMAGRGR